MTFKHKKHIFFDLDHTLWDFEKNSKLAYERLFSELNIMVDIDHFLKFYVPANFAFWKLYRDEKITQEQLRYQRLKSVFDDVGFDCSDNLINEIAHRYIELLPTNSYLYPGAKDLLEYLFPHYHLHIITNGFADVQNRKMQSSGLQKYFKTITNSEDAGVKKPNPLIFEKALTSSSALPHESLMIGDSLEADILGAKQLKIDTIFFNEHQATHEVDTVEVFHLSEIVTFFE
jgi:putative hydrolase of the HAD superfamily